MTLDALKEPFPITHQRPGPGGITITYIRPTQAMDRLDDVLGVGNWNCEYHLLYADDRRVAMKCRIITASGYVEGVGEATTDAAGGEAFKAAASDALKRAAVHLGVARYLYDDRPAPAGSHRPQAQAQVQRSAPAVASSDNGSHAVGETWTDQNGELRIQCPDHGGWWAMATRDGGIKCKKRIGDNLYCTYTVYPGEQPAADGEQAGGTPEFTAEVEAEYRRLLELQKQHGWTGKQLAAAFGVNEVTPRMIKRTMADGMSAEEIDAMVMEELPFE